MARTLDVYLHRHLAGRLIQDDHGRLGFAYAESWLNNPAATALSHSLPLRAERYSRRECRGFFAGILPEQGQRVVIARNLGISAQNDFALLERIGGECAGAVTFLPAGERLPERENQYRHLTATELASLIEELPRRPLLAGTEGIRLSLAGAQDKVAVHILEGRISIPLGGAPSTHILKPAIERFEGLVFNEALCMNLARAVGIPAAPVGIGKAGGIDYLLVERYDRTRRQIPGGGSFDLHREHQEDFCQALNIVPENKYQNEGGPSLKQCFALVREVATSAALALQAMLDAVIFNYLIGNHDAHGKNFSLLYLGETASQGSTQLAPLYDLLSTVYYPELSRTMAMKIGGETLSEKVLPVHFERMAEETGLAKPLVRHRVPELAEAIVEQLPSVTTDQPAAAAVAKLIRERCQRTIARFSG